MVKRVYFDRILPKKTTKYYEHPSPLTHLVGMTFFTAARTTGTGGVVFNGTRPPVVGTTEVEFNPKAAEVALRSVAAVVLSAVRLSGTSDGGGVVVEMVALGWEVLRYKG